MAQSDHSLVYPVNPRQLQDASRAYSNPRQVRSPSSSQIRKRIKITQKDGQKQPPSIKPDQERLIEEGLSLKMENNSFREENTRLKTRINQLDREIAKRDEFLDELRSQAGEKHYYVALKQGHLVSSLKQTVKELRFELKSREDELSKLRKTVKFTNISEIEAETEAYIEECNRLKRLLLESARPVSRGRMINSIDQAQGQIITKLNKEKLALEKNLQSAQEELARAKQREKTPVKEQKEASDLQAEISKVREDLTTKGKMVSQAEEKIRQQAATIKDTQEQLQAVVRERDTLRRRHNEVTDTLHELQARMALVESREIQSTLHFFVNKLASKKLSFVHMLQAFPGTGTFQDLVQRVEEARVVVPEQYWSALCKHYINDRGSVDFHRLITDVKPIKPKIRESALKFFTKKNAQKHTKESPVVQETDKTYSSREDISVENRFETGDLESDEGEQSESIGNLRINRSEVVSKRELMDESQSEHDPPAQDSEEYHEEEPEEVLSKRESMSKRGHLQVEVVEYNPSESLGSEPRESSAEGVDESERFPEETEIDRNPTAFDDQESISDRKIASERKAYEDLEQDFISSERNKLSEERSESIESKRDLPQSIVEKHSEVSSSPKSHQVFSRLESKIASQDESKLSAAPIDFSKGYESSSPKESKASTPKAIQFLSPKPSQSSESNRSKPESLTEDKGRSARSAKSSKVMSVREHTESSGKTPPESLELNGEQKSSVHSRKSSVSERRGQAVPSTLTHELTEPPAAEPTLPALPPDSPKSSSAAEVRSESDHSENRDDPSRKSSSGEEARPDSHHSANEYVENWGEDPGRSHSEKQSRSGSVSEEAFFEPPEESPSQVFNYPFSARDLDPAESAPIPVLPQPRNIVEGGDEEEDCPEVPVFPVEEQPPEQSSIEEPLTVQPLGSMLDALKGDFIATENTPPDNLKDSLQPHRSIDEESEPEIDEEYNADQPDFDEFFPELDESVQPDDEQSQRKASKSGSPKVTSHRSSSLSSSKGEPESPHIVALPVQSPPPPVSPPPDADSLHSSIPPEPIAENQPNDPSPPIEAEYPAPQIPSETGFPQVITLNDDEKPAETESDYVENPPENDLSAPQESAEVEKSSESEHLPVLEPSLHSSEEAVPNPEPDFFPVANTPKPIETIEPQTTDKFSPSLKTESAKGPIVDYQSLEGEKDHSSDSESKQTPAVIPPPPIDRKAPSESSKRSSVADPLIAKTRENIVLIASTLKSHDQSVREAFEDLAGWVSTADFLYGLRTLGIPDFPPEEFQLIVLSLAGNETGDMEIEDLERLFAVHGVPVRKRALSHISETTGVMQDLEASLKEELVRNDLEVLPGKPASPLSGSVRVTANPLSATGSVIEAIQGAQEGGPINEIEAQEVMTSEAEERKSSSNSDSFYEYAGEGSSRA